MTADTTAQLDSKAPAPGPLRDHLRTIPPERAEATTRLLAAGDRLLRDDGTTRLELRANVAQHPPHATTVVLTHAHGRVQLIITAEQGSAAIGDRTWHDFSGEARLLAWSLAYETLLGQLSDLLGVPLLPVELLPAPPASSGVWHWVALRFDAAADSHCEGLLGLDRAILDAVASADGWDRDDAGAAARSGRSDMPLPCRLRLPAQMLPAATVRALEPGDVLLIGQRAAAIADLRLCADTGEAGFDLRHAWAVGASAEGITIMRALTEGELRNETMNDDLPLEPESPADAESVDVRNAITLRVELLLDTLDLSLAEIDRISAGQILHLAQPVDGARVTLRANGKVFGSGELVSLGELLGVKITRIGDARGLQ